MTFWQCIISVASVAMSISAGLLFVAGLVGYFTQTSAATFNRTLPLTGNPQVYADAAKCWRRIAIAAFPVLLIGASGWVYAAMNWWRNS